MISRLSIVIPAYNEEASISNCLTSISEAYRPEDFDLEVIVVDDGSTDMTIEVASRFPGVQVLELGRNCGRFLARRAGFLESKYDVLYIDSRSFVDKYIILNLLKSRSSHPIQGASKGLDSIGRAKELTIFERVYTLVRRRIFSKYCLESSHFISKDIFDSHPKGTGVFFCPRPILQRVYEAVGTRSLVSDDTELLKMISDEKELFYDPSVFIVNYGRQDFVSSVTHLYNRGPKFVAYYGSIKSRYFKVINLSLISAAIIFFCSLFFPWLLLVASVSLCVVWLAFSIYLSNSLQDFILVLRGVPLITMVFGLGIMKGLYLRTVGKLS